MNVEQAKDTAATPTAVNITMARPLTISGKVTPPIRYATVSRGSVARTSSNVKTTEAPSLPKTMLRGRSRLTCMGMRVCRSRSPTTDPAVKPGTRNRTSSMVNSSVHSKIPWPAVASSTTGEPPNRLLAASTLLRYTRTRTRPSTTRYPDNITIALGPRMRSVNSRARTGLSQEAAELTRRLAG